MLLSIKANKIKSFYGFIKYLDEFYICKLYEQMTNIWNIIVYLTCL